MASWTPLKISFSLKFVFIAQMFRFVFVVVFETTYSMTQCEELENQHTNKTNLGAPIKNIINLVMNVDRWKNLIFPRGIDSQTAI